MEGFGLRGREFAVFSLFGVADGLALLPLFECFKARGSHAFEPDEFSGATDVDEAPIAFVCAGREADGVCAIAEGMTNAVDPAEAESFVEGFRVGDALLAGGDAVKGDGQIRCRGVIFLEPGAKRGGVREIVMGHCRILASLAWGRIYGADSIAREREPSFRAGLTCPWP